MSRIEFVEYTPTTSYVIVEDAFRYEPAKGWAWLQWLCIRFLRWRKCFALEPTVSYKRHLIDTSDLIRRIHEQHRSLMEHYHREGKRLLIGAETFAELMQQPRIEQYLNFSAEYGYGRSRQMFGMQITVVPHMVGMVVLPKEL